MTEKQVDTASSPTAEIEAANKEFYRESAARYEDYEHCVFAPCYQEMLLDDLAFISGRLSSRPKISCLDCGGGTGNIALKLLDRGWNVTVVDVSSQMLDILEERCRAQDLHPQVHNLPLGDFFESNDRQFDLISFGSVLHHLYSYKDIISSAVDALAPGGIIYSIYDPIVPRSKLLALGCSSFDTLLAKLRYDRSDFLPGLSRRIKKARMKSSGRHNRAVVSSGDLAEYHAKTGIDDTAVLHLLKGKGCEILRHVRYANGRTAAGRAMSAALRACEGCRIIAQHSEQP